MEVTVVGCSGSFAGPSSPASCYLVRAEHAGRAWSVVLDLGSGSLGALQHHAVPYVDDALDAVVLSHLHADHYADLCGLYVMLAYAPGRAGREPLPVWGPSGTGARLAAAHGNPDLENEPGVFWFGVVRDRRPVTIGPFTITPVLVEHPVEAYGYRVEAGGRTLVYTGDTDACDQLGELMRDADLVLADSAFVDGRDEARGIHLSGRRAAEAAVAAGGVARLMLTHLPVWNDPEVCLTQAADVWPGEVELARPGATYAV